MNVFNKNILFQKFLLVFLISLFFYGAFAFQLHLLFNSDVGYLLHAAEQLFLGGAYGNEIFETNPPMILYTYMPVVWMQQFHFFSITLMFLFYVFFFIVLSCAACFFLLKKIIPEKDRFLRHVILCAILFALLFLPVGSFGQREHLLVIFILPYLLLAAARLQGKSIAYLPAILIGFFASVGFSLKPFFLVTLCLIELYCIHQKKQLFYFLRLETAVIASILVSYLCVILYFQPGYIHQVLPLVLKYYFPFQKVPWSQLPQIPFAMFICAVVFGHFFFAKIDAYPHLGKVLWLALLGMIAALLIPRMPSYYHVLPVFSFTVILIAYYAGQFFKLFQISGYAIMTAALLLTVSPVIFDGIPLYYRLISNSVLNKKAQLQIGQYIQSHSNDYSVICLSGTTQPCFPLVQDIQGVYASRFPMFWWHRGIQQLSAENDMTAIQDKKRFIQLVTDDLNEHGARWVIANRYLVDFCSESENFRASFSRYAYRTTIDGRDVYERITKNI